MQVLPQAGRLFHAFEDAHHCMVLQRQHFLTHATEEVVDALGEDAVPRARPVLEQGFEVSIQLGNVRRSWQPVPPDVRFELNAGLCTYRSIRTGLPIPGGPWVAVSAWAPPPAASMKLWKAARMSCWDALLLWRSTTRSNAPRSLSVVIVIRCDLVCRRECVFTRLPCRYVPSDDNGKTPVRG